MRSAVDECGHVALGGGWIDVSGCWRRCGSAQLGHSLATSVKFISIYPMAVVWPGLVVTLMVIALNLFGDALRDAIDPLTNPALRQGEATHVESEERA